MLPLAEQAGDVASVKECEKRLKTALENFLTATDAAKRLESLLEIHWERPASPAIAPESP